MNNTTAKQLKKYAIHQLNYVKKEGGVTVLDKYKYRGLKTWWNSLSINQKTKERKTISKALK